MEGYGGEVAAGVDTHRDEHALCVVDRAGRVLGRGSFPATTAGYDALAEAIGGPTACVAVGVEGTGSYGAGLARRLAELGYEVVEVVRPGRARRRPGEGKSDPADAERAALDALAGRGCPPRVGGAWVEALRCRTVARDAAVGESTRAANRARALLVTAPAPVREALSGLGTPQLMARCSRRRRGLAEPERSLWDSLRSLAASWRAARRAAEEHEAAMRAILEEHAPALLAVPGCGAVSAAKLAVAAGGDPGRLSGEAAFASLCGACPVEASSGKVRRHRLNRGGDRQANRALHTIARVRMRCDERTRRYVERRISQGKTRREVERILVRYIAREVYRALSRPAPQPEADPARPGREARAERLRLGATQAQAAAALGVASARVSELERGVLLDAGLLARYREWLSSAPPGKSRGNAESGLDRT